MKKIKRKLHSKEQLDEVILGIAKAILGFKAKALAKAMEHDPALADAFDRHAEETVRFRKFLQTNYGEKTPEELATSTSEVDAILDKVAARKKK